MTTGLTKKETGFAVQNSRTLHLGLLSLLVRLRLQVILPLLEHPRGPKPPWVGPRVLLFATPEFERLGV